MHGTRASRIATTNRGIAAGQHRQRPAFSESKLNGNSPYGQSPRGGVRSALARGRNPVCCAVDDVDHQTAADVLT